MTLGLFCNNQHVNGIKLECAGKNYDY